MRKHGAVLSAQFCIESVPHEELRWQLAELVHRWVIDNKDRELSFELTSSVEVVVLEVFVVLMQMPIRKLVDDLGSVQERRFTF